jgi:hypothetical protein
MVMLLYGIVGYLLITFIFTLFGINRQAEVFKLFLISLLLTPISGAIWMFKKRPHSKNINYYYCEECHYVYPVKMGYCPICAEEGKKVKLKKYKSPYNFSKSLQKLTLA